MQGVRVNHEFCPTKKALKEAVAADPATVTLIATSLFGNEYDGPLDQAPTGRYTMCGPDENRNRKWYANIVKAADGTVKVS